MYVADPEYGHMFWFIPALLMLLWWNHRQKSKALARFADGHLVPALIRGVSRTGEVLKSGIFLLSFVFLFLAMIRPQWGSRLETVRRKGIDIMVALDTSLSMEVQDVSPCRLEKAKHEIRSLIDILQGDRVGLIVFAGMSQVDCPLTVDLNAVKLFLDIIDTRLIPKPGTNIGEAIRIALRSFGAQGSRQKVLILVTDGENLEGDPLSAAEEAKRIGVVIYTLGVGTAAGEPIPLRDEKGNVSAYKKDESGSTVVSRLDESSLEKIANISGGKYFRASPSEDEIKSIQVSVSQMDKQDFQSQLYLTYIDRFQIPLGIGLFLIFVEMLIPAEWRAWTNTGAAR